MADVQTTDINTKPTVTAIDSNDQIYISDGGTALKKISYTNLAKAIIEQYNASQLAGATKTIQTAINDLNSNKLPSIVSESTGGASYNLNDLRTQGLYYINPASQNVPTNTTWGWLVVIKRNSEIMYQQFIGTNGLEYRRHSLTATTWGDWYQLPSREEIEALNSKINNPSITTIEDLNTYLNNLPSAGRGIVMVNGTVANALIERNASAIATVAKMDNSTADMSLYSLGGNYIGIIRYNFSTSTVTKEIDLVQTAAGYVPTISGNSTLVVQNIGFMYFRFGSMMMISGRLNITNKGDGTGNLRISLPTGFKVTTGSVGSYGTITPDINIENKVPYASMSMRADTNADNIYAQYGAGSNSMQFLQPGYHMIFAVIPVTKTS